MLLISRGSGDVEHRNKIQEMIFNRYMEYAAFSFENLPEDMKMTKEQRIQFKISFDMLSDRKTGMMNGKNIVHFFSEYSKAHKFTIPLHPEFLLPIVNPFFNNLINFVSTLLSLIT